jgi:hypothetical protein
MTRHDNTNEEQGSISEEEVVERVQSQLDDSTVETIDEEELEEIVITTTEVMRRIEYELPDSLEEEDVGEATDEDNYVLPDGPDEPD